MATLGVPNYALESLNPQCPTCGRLADPPGPLRDLSALDRVTPHLVECVCGVMFMATFYRSQKGRDAD